MKNSKEVKITADIISRINNGDIKAFEIIFNMYYQRVLHYTLGMTKRRIESEEIAQNVFMKLWINRTILNTDKSINSYIFTIVKNEIYDFFRSEKYALQYTRDLTSAENIPISDVKSEYNIQEIKEIVNKTITSMPFRRREIFKMSREQYMTNDEIAAKLDISKRTVEKHISLALATIRKNLGDFMFFLFFFFL